eukprot:489834-Rhodomonas_salina.4
MARWMAVQPGRARSSVSTAQRPPKAQRAREERGRTHAVLEAEVDAGAGEELGERGHVVLDDADVARRPPFLLHPHVHVHLPPPTAPSRASAPDRALRERRGCGRERRTLSLLRSSWTDLRRQAAAMRGVRPRLSRALASTLACASSSATACLFPLSAARCSAVCAAAPVGMLGFSFGKDLRRIERASMCWDWALTAAASAMVAEKAREREDFQTDLMVRTAPTAPSRCPSTVSCSAVRSARAPRSAPACSPSCTPRSPPPRARSAAPAPPCCSPPPPGTRTAGPRPSTPWRPPGASPAGPTPSRGRPAGSPGPAPPFAAPANPPPASAPQRPSTSHSGRREEGGRTRILCLDSSLAASSSILRAAVRCWRAVPHLARCTFTSASRPGHPVRFSSSITSNAFACPSPPAPLSPHRFQVKRHRMGSEGEQRGAGTCWRVPATSLARERTRERCWRACLRSASSSSFSAASALTFPTATAASRHAFQISAMHTSAPSMSSLSSASRAPCPAVPSPRHSVAKQALRQQRAAVSPTSRIRRREGGGEAGTCSAVRAIWSSVSTIESCSARASAAFRLPAAPAFAIASIAIAMCPAPTAPRSVSRTPRALALARGRLRAAVCMSRWAKAEDAVWRASLVALSSTSCPRTTSSSFSSASSSSGFRLRPSHPPALSTHARGARG